MGKGTVSKLLNFPNIEKEETIQEKVICPKAHRLNTHQMQKHTRERLIFTSFVNKRLYQPANKG